MMLFLKLLFFLLAPLNHFIKTKKLYSLTPLGLVQVYPVRPVTALEFVSKIFKTDGSFVSRGAGTTVFPYSYPSVYIQLSLGVVGAHTYFRSICTAIVS